MNSLIITDNFIRNLAHFEVLFKGTIRCGIETDSHCEGIDILSKSTIQIHWESFFDDPTLPQPLSHNSG